VAPFIFSLALILVFLFPAAQYESWTTPLAVLLSVPLAGLGTTTVVITGPSGTAWSPDEGDTWELLDGLTDYWAVDFASPQAGWLVGTEGRIIKISF
jgi:hypothetical protein